MTHRRFVRPVAGAALAAVAVITLAGCGAGQEAKPAADEAPASVAFIPCPRDHSIDAGDPSCRTQAVVLQDGETASELAQHLQNLGFDAVSCVDAGSQTIDCSEGGKVTSVSPHGDVPMGTPITIQSDARSIEVPQGVMGEPLSQVIAALKKAGYTGDLSITLADGSGVTLADLAGGPDAWKVASPVTDSIGVQAQRAPERAALQVEVEPAHACQFDETVPADTQACHDADPRDHVVYVISDAGSAASVTYVAEDGTIQQDTNVSLPWMHKFTTFDSTASFYDVSAQNNGGGTITCAIKVNGRVVTQHSAHGEFAIVDCQL